MSAIACIVLIVCVLILMIHFAIGPFAHDRFYEHHLRFKGLSPILQRALVNVAVVLSIVSSLWIIGVFA